MALCIYRDTLPIWVARTTGFPLNFSALKGLKSLQAARKKVRGIVELSVKNPAGWKKYIRVLMAEIHGESRRKKHFRWDFVKCRWVSYIYFQWQLLTFGGSVSFMAISHNSDFMSLTLKDLRNLARICVILLLDSWYGGSKIWIVKQTFFYN